MIIETIFNRGDEVWILSGDKAVLTRIYGASFMQTNYSDFTWDLYHNEGGHTAKRPESKIFKTKEDLIKSL